MTTAARQRLTPEPVESLTAWQLALGAPCGYHHRKAGEPCWSWPTSEGGPAGALCGRRANPYVTTASYR